MSTHIFEIVDDDDEVVVLHSTPASVTNGATKANAISVEDYKPDKGKRKIADDELIVLSPKKRRFFKGECSNSKSPTPVVVVNRIPSISTCEICTDETPRPGMFRVLGCPHYYCCACIVNYVASKLQDNITKINCPVPGCNGFLEPYHCSLILPKEVFDRWGDALCESVIVGSERFYCPFKDCSALLIDDNGENEVIPISECPYCHRLFCRKCKVPWHAGFTCEEFSKWSNEDIMLIKLAQSNNWKRCPICAIYVQKISGCQLVTCRCGCLFCYNCGAIPCRCHANAVYRRY